MSADQPQVKPRIHAGLRAKSARSDLGAGWQLQLLRLVMYRPGAAGSRRRLSSGLTAMLCQDLSQLSVEAFFSLKACANDEDHFWGADTGAKEVPSRSEGNNGLAQRLSLTYLAAPAG